MDEWMDKYKYFTKTHKHRKPKKQIIKAYRTEVNLVFRSRFTEEAAYRVRLELGEEIQTHRVVCISN